MTNLNLVKVFNLVKVLNYLKYISKKNLLVFPKCLTQHFSHCKSSPQNASIKSVKEIFNQSRGSSFLIKNILREHHYAFQLQKSRIEEMKQTN